MAEYKDYYAILGVDRKATEEQIKKHYRKLARQYHPDANPNNPQAEARFKAISEAYEVLGDPAKRQEYDTFGMFGGFGGAGPRPAGHGAPGGFGGAAGFGGLDDILQAVFRGAGAAAHQAQAARPQRGADLEVETAITLEEAALGSSITVSITPLGGETKRLKVSIPPGVDTGARVRVPKEGDAGRNGGAPGDLFVKVTVKPHPRFTRDGWDLSCELPVSVFDAVLGGEVAVPTLEGDVKIKLAPGTQGGTVFRLKHKGIPHLKGGGRGVLHARVALQIPEAPSEEQLALWRRLAARDAVIT